MLFGIIDAILLIIICMRFIEKRFFRSKHTRILSITHFPASLLFILITALHIVTVLRLLKSRPTYILISGILSLPLIFLAIYSGYKTRKGQAKHNLHLLTALGACIYITSHIFLGFASVISYQNHVDGLTIEDIDLSTIADGVYTGECDVTYIYAKVNVTVESGKIKDITLLTHRNERGESAECIIDDIIDQQIIDVDAISGASNSSAVVKKAIENAISTADKAN